MAERSKTEAFLTASFRGTPRLRGGDLGFFYSFRHLSEFGVETTSSAWRRPCCPQLDGDRPQDGASEQNASRHPGLWRALTGSKDNRSISRRPTNAASVTCSCCIRCTTSSRTWAVCSSWQSRRAGLKVVSLQTSLTHPFRRGRNRFGVVVNMAHGDEETLMGALKVAQLDGYPRHSTAKSADQQTCCQQSGSHRSQADDRKRNGLT